MTDCHRLIQLIYTCMCMMEFVTDCSSLVQLLYMYVHDGVCDILL